MAKKVAKKPKILILIPAYNEGTVLGDVVKQVKKEGFKNVIVVNDCSTDNTAQVAKKAGAIVLNHKVNQGAGAATRTGIEYAINEEADYAVTIDADGQHDPKEIQKLIKAAKKYDVVIGSRMIKPKGMPLIRQFLNFGGSIVTWVLYGLYVKDSQSGFKLFTKKALPHIKITLDRFEFCSEILYRIKQAKLTYTEVPIRTIYTEYSLSKGQHLFNGPKMLLRMIRTRRGLNK